jgi:hypothetical protein
MMAHTKQQSAKLVLFGLGLLAEINNRVRNCLVFLIFQTQEYLAAGRKEVRAVIKDSVQPLRDTEHKPHITYDNRVATIAANDNRVKTESEVTYLCCAVLCVEFSDLICLTHQLIQPVSKEQGVPRSP